MAFGGLVIPPIPFLPFCKLVFQLGDAGFQGRYLLLLGCNFFVLRLAAAQAGGGHALFDASLFHEVVFEVG